MNVQEFRQEIRENEGCGGWVGRNLSKRRNYYNFFQRIYNIKH